MPRKNRSNKPRQFKPGPQRPGPYQGNSEPFHKDPQFHRKGTPFHKYKKEQE